MYCTNCGNKLEESAKFCQNCGTKVAQNEKETLADAGRQKLNEPKRRKTLDEHLGIFGLLTIAIIGSIFVGGILSILSPACGISAVYYIFKKNKQLDGSQKIIAWVMVALWILLYAYFHSNPAGLSQN